MTGKNALDVFLLNWLLSSTLGAPDLSDIRQIK
jgi:hypothetical protein